MYQIHHATLTFFLLMQNNAFIVTTGKRAIIIFPILHICR